MLLRTCSIMIRSLLIYVAILYILDVVAVAANFTCSVKPDVLTIPSLRFMNLVDTENFLFNGGYYSYKNVYEDDRLFFLHISKTGGTTLNALIAGLPTAKRNTSNDTYMSRFCSFDPNFPENTSDLVFAPKLPLEDKPECTYYAIEVRNFTHMLALNPTLNSWRLITILREPVSLYLSSSFHKQRGRAHFHQNCRRIADQLHNVNCSKFPANLLTVSLGDGYADHVDEAIRNLCLFFFVGITDYFEASMCLLSYQLGLLHNHDSPNCFKPTIVHNPGLYKPTKNAVTETDLVYLNNLLEADRILYHFGLDLFLQRIIIAELNTGIPMMSREREGNEIMSLKEAVMYTKWKHKSISSLINSNANENNNDGNSNNNEPSKIDLFDDDDGVNAVNKTNT